MGSRARGAMEDYSKRYSVIGGRTLISPVHASISPFDRENRIPKSRN